MRTFLRAILGVSIGAILLWLAWRQLDPAQIGPIISRVEPVFCFFATALYWAAMSVRIARWRVILESRKVLSYKSAAEGLLVGYAVNNVLPARLGELFRADFVARRNGIARSGVLGCVIIERVQDLIAVVVLLNLGLFSITGDASSSPFAWLAPTASAGALASIGLLVGFAVWHERLPLRWAPWLRARLNHLADALVGVKSRLAVTAVLTTIIWTLEAAALFCLLHAFNVSAGPFVVALCMGASALASLLPSAPGFVGSLQMAFVLAFGAVGLPATPAAVVATATQIFLLGSVTAVGLLILAVIHPNKSRAAGLSVKVAGTEQRA